MSEWKEYKLSDVCLKIGSGATPRGGQESYLSYGEYTLIRSQNVLDFDFTMKGLAYINEAQASKLNNVEIKERDILLNITGDSVARVCQVPSYILPARVNQHVAIIRPNRDIINNEYLKYYLLEPKVKDYLLMISSSGGTRNAITKNMLEELVIQVPDLPTQTAIAEILSSLDDKIELNNKINQELENLAQTLFKQWFIDFEFPNENGEPYKSSGGEMVDSELGEIPEGWGVKLYSEIADINLGGTPSSMKPEYWDGEIPWVNSGGINKNFIIKGIKGISELGLKKSATKLIRENSTLVAITGATLGQVSYSFIEACYNQSVVSITTEKLLNEYVHQYVLCFISELTSHQTGGAQQHINKGDVEKSNILLPQKNILENFNPLISSLYHKIELNIKEIEYLTNTRDLLLPKLISGELEINEISK